MNIAVGHAPNVPAHNDVETRGGHPARAPGRTPRAARDVPGYSMPFARVVQYLGLGERSRLPTTGCAREHRVASP
jgi:hypothetical protein